MSGFEVGHPRAYMLQLQEFRTRVDNGWVPFGWHVAYPGVRLDFDGRDELSGDPVWERNAEWDACRDGVPYSGQCLTCGQPEHEPALSFTEQEADRNARGVKPGEHLIAAADAADVGRAELDGLNQDQFTAVHALLRRLEREQPGIVTDAELSAICGLPPWWKPLRQREPGARPCCHTTGPNHHPACTTDRTEQQ